MKKALTIVLAIMLLICMVGCEQKPEMKTATNGVQISEYTNFDFTQMDYVVSDEYIDFVLNDLVESYGSIEEITDGAVSEGDMISLSYTTYWNDEELDEAVISDYVFTIGEGKFYEEFERQLVGKPIGEEFEIALDYPLETTHTVLDGKSVVHKVTIHHLCQTNYPELTDEFIQEIAKNSDSVIEQKCTTVEEYKEYLKERYEFLYQQQSRDLLISDILNQLLETAVVPKISEDDITDYENSRYDYYVEYCSNAGISIETYFVIEGITEEEFRNQLRTDGENIIKKTMLVNAIIEFENMELTDEYYKEYLEYLTEEYQVENVEDLKSMIEELAVEDTIRNDALHEMVYDFLIQSNNIEFEKIDLVELTESEAD